MKSKKRIEREIGFPPMLTNAYKIVDYANQRIQNR